MKEAGGIWRGGFRGEPDALRVPVTGTETSMECVVAEETMSVVLSGRVQGVGFRAWTRRWAEREGVRGWVRNCRDGTVEVHAAGPDEALNRFVEALQEGPRAARVRGLERRDEAGELPEEGFEIRF